MDFHLDDKAIVYLDKNGCFSSQKTDREVEVDIIVVDTYDPHQEVFVTSSELNDCSDDETIVINEKCKQTWERGSQNGTYKFRCDLNEYMGQRGSWTTSTYLFPVANKGRAPIARRREEKPCQVCERPNDVGVHACWWCGSDPHSSAYR